MRIAFLTPEFVSEKKFDGGLANYLQRTALALRDAGHQPEVFVTAERDEETELRGIPVHRIRLYSPTDWRIMRLGCRLFRLKWFASWETYCVARSLARGFIPRHTANPFDIVQSSDFHGTGLLIPKNGTFTHITRLSWYAPAYRKAYQRPETLDIRLKEKLEVISLRRAHHVYGPSSQLASVVSQELGIKVDVIHPPAYAEIAPQDEDASVYELQLKDKRYVLFFGRLCRPKGVYTLAKAMADVLTRRPELDLVLVGREDPPGILNELRAILGEVASARTIHMARLRHPQLFPIVRHAECVCLPSLIDNFPNTCLEAMALGQIVIGTRGTGFEDLIRDGENGFLAKFDDAAQLAATIHRALDLDSDQRSRIEAAAIRRVADFAPSRMIPELISYYQQCLGARMAKGVG
jgi:glycogen synthase